MKGWPAAAQERGKGGGGGVEMYICWLSFIQLHVYFIQEYVPYGHQQQQHSSSTYLAVGIYALLYCTPGNAVSMTIQVDVNTARSGTITSLHQKHVFVETCIVGGF